MLIFDIGANLGVYTQELLNKYSDATVILIEANPKLVPALIQKFISNPNVKIYHHVVSEKSGETIDFYLNNAVHTVSTASQNWIKNSRFSDMKWDEVIKVDSITVDEMVDAFGIPDIIKIDVEGYELSVIKGITKKYKLIQFEYAEEELDGIRESLKWLISLGYDQISFKETDNNHSVIPEIFYTEDEFEHVLLSTLDSNRKERWGMIYVK